MKFQVLSDLHLERHPQFVPRPAPGAEILILAGDIGSYQSGSLLADDDFGLGRFSTRAPNCPWKSVLFVPGNHEYDGLDFDDTYRRLQAACDRLGLTWLERQMLTIDGVRFVGTTLWCDFDALALRPRRQDKNRAALDPVSPLTWQLQQREKAFRAANYYLAHNTTLRNGVPMLAEDLRTLALDCQAWLRNALAVPFDGATVVVTHFAPSLRSHDPRYGMSPGTAGFCNTLDDLFPLVDVWVHGHLHCPHDYVVAGDVGGTPYRCRVVANPLGYADKGEQETFDPEFVVELPHAAPPVAV